MNILVIRHGQPLDESKTGGEGDPPLSELGHAQARSIGDYLANASIDKIVASPMVRAHQTALPLCEILGMEPELDDDFIFELDPEFLVFMGAADVNAFYKSHGSFRKKPTRDMG